MINHYRIKCGFKKKKVAYFKMTIKKFIFARVAKAVREGRIVLDGLPNYIRSGELI
jgi:hypothetical protein